MAKAPVVILLLLVYTYASGSLIPYNLKCESVNTPLVIDISQPSFSWMVRSNEKDKMQSAYEIVVGDDSAEVKEGKGSFWESGKVSGSNSLQIMYQGRSLQSLQRYYWAVKVYDEDGVASQWSTPAVFETSFLSKEEWKAKWISDGSINPSNDADAFKRDPMPLFRKEFTTNKSIAKARLYIVGLGYYEAFLNGKRISDHVLDPGWTSYKSEVLYAVHDVTSLVNKGRNVIAAALGNGWWNPLPIKLFGRWDLREYQQTGRPCLKGELHITYSDGSKDVVVTDGTWKSAPGPVIRNSVYVGETYDARLEQTNWNTIGKTSSAWRPTVEVEGPKGKLVSQKQPPIRITSTLKPVKVTNPKPDTFIVDMGQNFAGVVRLKVKGPEGRKITLRYGEDIYKDGTLNFATAVMTQIRKGGIKGGPGAPETAWQEDSYILKGEGVEEWAPRFTFHGFRYVEVVGWPGRPTVNDFTGLRMNSDLEVSGQFSCSNPMLNDIQKTVLWTFLSNVFSVQSDCPAREKLGYGADMVVTANAFIYNFDMTNFYRKALYDFVNDQQPDGGITETAPFVGIADRGYGGYSGPLGWTLAFPFLQKQLYDFYGDKRIIEEMYPMLQKQLQFLQSKSVEGLFHWDIGDHEALDPRAEAFSAAAFYYHHAELAREFAGIIGKTEDATKYERLSAEIKRLIVRKYLVPGTGRFDNATQAAQIFALWYNLTPEEENTFNVLMEEFKRHNMHVSSGIYGVKMMFDVLRERNRNDVAYQIATQKDFPGWGHMLSKGATTLWETWEYPETYPSQNHPMFGSISEWFYRSLLGINPALPGFEKITIKPQPAGDLSWAKGSYESVRGVIVSDWRIDGNSFTLNVTIPANSTAEVWIPGIKNSVITESGKPLSAAITREEIPNASYVKLRVGSGTYSFHSSLFK